MIRAFLRALFGRPTRNHPPSKLKLHPDGKWHRTLPDGSLVSPEARRSVQRAQSQQTPPSRWPDQV